ncbi:serine hydrolase domain-containing protein [Alteromonadaceae bacterium BrNp21-10]|nr:serine hydrolase domain-containing protein [Alteromonadaceae bacterium BrNp21-10]
MNIFRYFSLLLIAASTFSYAESKVNFDKIFLELDRGVLAILDEHGAPGVAIGFVEGSKIVGYKFYGSADIKNQTVFDENTMFNIGSISKVATGWGVMQLVQDGKVDLDKPINSYLKRWKIPDSKFDSQLVTLRNVMSHTSGLSLGPVGGWDKPTDKSIVDFLNGDNNAGGDVKLILEPNTQFSYSGGGYAVIQLLIEDVSGQKFNEFMTSQVFLPLGMTSTTFEVNEELMRRSATPYDQEGKATSMIYFAATAAAGMHTTTHDLALFSSTLLKDDKGTFIGQKLLKEKWISEIMKPVAATGNRLSISYYIDEENESFGFAGYNRGWIALTRTIVSRNYGYAILTNSNISPITNEVDALILKTVNENSPR